MKRSLRWKATLAALIMVLGSAEIVRADHGDQNNNNEVRLKTRLAGAAIQGKTPEGSAEFRSDQRGRTKFMVEVENINLPAGTVLDVAVQHNGASQTVGQIKLSAAGSGELELESQDGDTVPAVQAGDMVTVSNAGTTILAGVF